MAYFKKPLLVFIAAVTILFVIFINPVGPGFRTVVIFNGTERVSVTTDKVFTEDILKGAGIHLTVGIDRVYPGVGEKCLGDSIIVAKGKTVILVTANEEKLVTSWAGTVAELLAEQGFSEASYLVSHPLEQRLATGQIIRIIQVTSEYVSMDVNISAETVYKDDPGLPQGNKKVSSAPIDGLKQVLYKVLYHDGVEVSRILIGEKIISSPVAGVVFKGTKSIARSGEKSKTTVGIASYYGAKLHGKLTASGVPFDMHAFTAAHKTLPFGTKVKVTLLSTGKSVVVVINDRGPFIKGRIIDLSQAAAKAIGLFSRGVGKVRIEVVP